MIKRIFKIFKTGLENQKQKIKIQLDKLKKTHPHEKSKIDLLEKKLKKKLPTQKEIHKARGVISEVCY